MTVSQFIRNLPKAELHVHIEGTFEPELMLAIAQRNGVSLPFATVDEARSAYRFSNLQDFLDIYYQGVGALLTERDFRDLTCAYFDRVASQNVRHAEIFFDPQAHTARGVPFSAVCRGISRGLQYAHRKHGITSRLIMCFLRHLDETAAFATLEEALPFRGAICAVGLDSGEAGNPPSKFAPCFCGGAGCRTRLRGPCRRGGTARLRGGSGGPAGSAAHRPRQPSAGGSGADHPPGRPGHSLDRLSPVQPQAGRGSITLTSTRWRLDAQCPTMW